MQLSVRCIVRSAVSMLILASGSAVAQCDPEWADGLFDPHPNFPTNGSSGVFVGYDDGSGTQVYRQDRRWNGRQWTPTPWMTNGHDVRGVYCTALGEHLYAAVGNNLQRWNGSSWETLPPPPFNNCWPHQMMLNGVPYLGLTCVISSTQDRIYVLDGNAWTQVGDDFNGTIYDVAVLEAGTEDIVVVAGSFTSNGLQPASRIAWWDGTQWLQLGGGANGIVRSLYASTSFGGPKIFAGGAFSEIGGVNVPGIAAWDGTQWASAALNGGGLAGSVQAIAEMPDAMGTPRLYAVTTSIFRLGDTAWEPLSVTLFDGTVGTMVPNDLGDGVELYVGGSFTQFGGQASPGIARLTNAGPRYFANGVRGEITELLAGPDDKVYAVGRFPRAGQEQAIRAAVWDGHEWKPLLSPQPLIPRIRDVEAAAFWKGPDDPQSLLYVAGDDWFPSPPFEPFEGVARWTGTTWEQVGDFSQTPNIYDMVVLGEGAGSQLFIGGRSIAPAPNFTTYGVAAWDVTRWKGIGRVDSEVLDLAVLDLGDGPMLYAAGNFSNVNGVPAQSIARYNGTQWEEVAGGLEGPVYALYAGPEIAPALLWAGGHRMRVSPSDPWMNGIAAWDGTTWSPVVQTLVDGGSGGRVERFVSVDDGTGRSLIMTGMFSAIDGAPFTDNARWNGSSFERLYHERMSGRSAPVVQLPQGMYQRKGFMIGASRHLPSNDFLDEGVSLWLGCEIPECVADFSGSADPNDPAYGVPDGLVDSSDFFYFLDQFAADNVGVADLSASVDPNDPGYGVPDGVIDSSDFFYFLDLFAVGCV